ncbi:MAG: bile acid:sodium symporter [Sediminispirochaetaceae bacterium]
MKVLRSFVSKNWFILSLLGLILLSFIEPSIGHAVGLGGATSKVLIIVIFLITGLTLPSETILSRLSNIKLHLFIQSFSFILIPLYVVLTASLLKGVLHEWTLVGLYATAVLPTTISSNIIFTQASGGNVVASTFNAALGNVMGIFISPLLLSFILQSTGRVMPAEELLGILQSLFLLMLLPIGVGQILRLRIRGVVKRYGSYMRKSTSAMILLIVFITMSKAVYTDLFDLSGGGLVIALAYLAVSHLLFLAIVYGCSRLLRFSREDRICALFTGTQKTLAMGAPLLSIFFADRPELLAASVVPLSYYHLWQLVVAGFVRGALVKQEQEA